MKITHHNTAPRELAHRLNALAIDMWSLGLDMEYYGGMSEIAEHGRELVGASDIAIGRARGIQQAYPIRWKCQLCGRDKFTRPGQPHKCLGGFRKNFKRAARQRGMGNIFVPATN